MCNELERIAFCIWRIIDSNLSPTSSFIFCSTSFEKSLPLARVFQCFFTFALFSASSWLHGGNLTAQSTGSHRGIGGGIQTPAGLLLSEMLFLHLLTMPRAYAVIGLEPLRYSHMKGADILKNHWRRPIWGCPNVFLTPKSDLFKLWLHKSSK